MLPILQAPRPWAPKGAPSPRGGKARFKDTRTGEGGAGRPPFLVGKLGKQTLPPFRECQGGLEDTQKYLKNYIKLQRREIREAKGGNEKTKMHLK